MLYHRRMIHDELEFKIEEWHDGHIVAVLALCTNLLIGRAAFFEAVKQRPGRSLTLRIGARVIESSG